MDDGKKEYVHSPDACPSNHWNDGDDRCEDCGKWLNEDETPEGDPTKPSSDRFNATQPPSCNLPQKILQAYHRAAKREHQDDGMVEIDDNALVSVNDEGGAYVQAYIYVTDSDACVCEKCRVEMTDDGEGYDDKCGSCQSRAVNPEVWKPESVWDNHDEHSTEDWTDEVINGDTRQSYIQWVNSKIEQENAE